MAAVGFIKEEMFADHGFSFSVGDNILESSNSVSSWPEHSPNGSVGKTTSQLNTMNNSSKRKNTGASNKTRKSSGQTRTVKTTNLTDDGFGWRKYGQKNIHNNPHPKSYYRCTHHTEEKCEAKKWVQKESDNPPIFNTTYLGQHTCQNPLKIPQIFLPYTCSGYSSSPDNNITDSKPFLLRFDSPSSNQHYFAGQMGFGSLPSSPPVDDIEVFPDQPTITESGMSMDAYAGSMQQGLEYDHMFEDYEDGSGGMIGATPEEYYSRCLSPMESPNCNFDFNMMMIEEYLLHGDNFNYLE